MDAAAHAGSGRPWRRRPTRLASRVRAATQRALAAQWQQQRPPSLSPAVPQARPTQSPLSCCSSCVRSRLASCISLVSPCRCWLPPPPSPSPSPFLLARPSPIRASPAALFSPAMVTTRSSRATESPAPLFDTPSALTSPSVARAAGSARAPAWSHVPSNLTLIWLFISLPLVIWDCGYILLRPYTLPGGSLHSPIWVPYG